MTYTYLHGIVSETTIVNGLATATAYRPVVSRASGATQRINYTPLTTMEQCDTAKPGSRGTCR